MDKMLKSKKKIIFLDETIFTSKTILTREYSNKGCNIEINRNLLNDSYYSAVAAISTDNKVEHVYLHDGSIN